MDPNFSAEGLGFADDIAAIGYSEQFLKEVITRVENWCKRNRMELNKDKSSIMVIRKDRRTPLPLIKEVEGVKVTSSSKYLGMHLDDCLNFEVELGAKQEMFDRLKKAHWIIRGNKLTSSTKYHVWLAIFKSKIWYQALILAHKSAKASRWI